MSGLQWQRRFAVQVIHLADSFSPSSRFRGISPALKSRAGGFHPLFHGFWTTGRRLHRGGVPGPSGVGMAHAKEKAKPDVPTMVRERALRSEAQKMQPGGEKKPD